MENFLNKPIIEMTFSSGAVVQCYGCFTASSKRNGLRRYPDLKSSTGLWFPYNKQGRPMFWNRGVSYPVDIAFIDKAMNLHTIFQMEADSSTIVIPPHLTAHVIEMRGGSFERLSIKVGDRVAKVRRLNGENPS